MTMYTYNLFCAYNYYYTEHDEIILHCKYVQYIMHIWCHRKCYRLLHNNFNIFIATKYTGWYIYIIRRHSFFFQALDLSVTFRRSQKTSSNNKWLIQFVLQRGEKMLLCTYSLHVHTRPNPHALERLLPVTQEAQRFIYSVCWTGFGVIFWS